MVVKGSTFLVLNFTSGIIAMTIAFRRDDQDPNYSFSLLLIGGQGLLSSSALEWVHYMSPTCNIFDI
eukprot:Awhi_evm1s7979